MRGGPYNMGQAMAQLFEAQLYKPSGSPGVDSTSNRTKYQEYFLGGVKATGAHSWPYYIHEPIFFKSDSLNLLQPSRPVQACTEISLPLPILT